MKSKIYSKEHKLLVKRVKQARIKAGLTQVEAAKLLKKTQPYVSSVEAGQRIIDVIELLQYARIYNRNLGFFLRGLEKHRSH